MVTLTDTRWRLRGYRLIFLLFVALTTTVIFFIWNENIIEFFRKRRFPESHVIQTMHLIVVSCGRPNYQGIKDFDKPLDLSLTMIKSAALFAKAPLHLHIFTELEMKGLFEGEINKWPNDIMERVSYSIYSADYSDQLPQELVNEWKKWYKPCGSFRLLVPMILKEKVDAAIYSDSDVVFVKPIDELWSYFYKMDKHQVAAISPTAGHPLGGSSTNENFISHPSGLFQINSGIMLMNFTRILIADWKMFHGVTEQGTIATAKYGVDLLLPYYKKYKDKAEHDQKLLNIMFHFNPDLLYQLPCSWNFKNNFCVDDSNVCADGEERGAGAVHGISGAFFGSVNPTFKSLYETFLEYDLQDDLELKIYRSFLARVGRYAAQTYCGKKADVIAKPLKASIDTVNLSKRKDPEIE